MRYGDRARTTLLPVWLLMAACLVPQLAYAHPMGNFSVNHYSQISIRQGEIEILYMIDMAEIPTYQEIQQAGVVAKDGDPSLTAYLPAKGRSLKDGLLLELDGRRLPLKLVSQQIIFPPGAGGLPTLKMGFVYRAELPSGGANARVRYADSNFAGHAGWKEIIVDAPAGALESSSVPRTDRSNRLSNYPTDLLNTAPQDLEAEITFRPSLLAASGGQPRKPVSAEDGGSDASLNHEGHKGHEGRKPETAKESVGTEGNSRTVVQPASTTRVDRDQPLRLQANQQATPRSSFTELMAAKKFSFWFLLPAAILAAGLGALHALEPGHGKTIVAAYLVGSKGTAGHALVLGIIVTASHTAGVYALGAITLYAQKYILPERLYPFLGVLSGILIAGMGCYLLLQRYLGAEFAHKHSYETSPEKAGSRLGSSELFLLGMTGGMVPCPGALVVLLSAVALHRTGLGLFLIVAFSIGLAFVLIAMGLAAVYARRALSRLRLEGPLIQQWLPMASATVITILGCGIAVRGLMAAGLIRIG